MTDPSESMWWWQYGLDGVVGGLVGGVVTGVAVWLTLRHERRLANDLANRDAAVRVSAAAARLLAALEADRPAEAERVDLHIAGMELYARCARDWPSVAANLKASCDAVAQLRADGAAAGGEVGTAIHRAELEDLATTMGTAAVDWLASPRAAERAALSGSRST